MGFFRKRRKDFIDLTKHYNRQQDSQMSDTSDSQESESSSENNAEGLGFFGAISNTVSDSSESPEPSFAGSSSVEERRRKLSKRLLDMTEKIEELSNQIYHLQQRIEVLERKAGVGERFREM